MEGGRWCGVTDVEGQTGRDRVQRIMYAARISESHVEVRLRVGVYPRRKAVVLRDVGTTCRLLVLIEDSSVRARLATARHLAEDGLLARWQNVISRRASTEEAPEVNVCTRLEVAVQS